MMHYLYYKLYQATLKGSLSDVAHYAAPTYFGALLCLNFMILNALLSKLDIIPYLFPSTKFIGLLGLLSIVISYLYFDKTRRDRINEKYLQESNANRIKGNIIVAVYVALSFLSIFVVAFYKPGKL